MNNKNDDATKTERRTPEVESTKVSDKSTNDAGIPYYINYCTYKQGVITRENTVSKHLQQSVMFLHTRLTLNMGNQSTPQNIAAG